MFISAIGSKVITSVDFEPFVELLIKRFQERKVDHLHFQHWKTGPATDIYTGPTTPSTMVFMYLGTS